MLVINIGFDYRIRLQGEDIIVFLDTSRILKRRTRSKLLLFGIAAF